MKTKLLILAFSCGLMLTMFGQKATMELTFTSENNGEYVSLDSILIKNLTQGGDTTLYAPDTVLVIDYAVTSINDNKSSDASTFSISQNYPNPFKGKTSININVLEKEDIVITIRDIIGRELVQYKNNLNKGNHSFIFYSGNSKYYLLTVTGKQSSRTIKMLNSNTNSVFEGQCKLEYNNYEENKVGFKSQSKINAFVFNIGDELQYTGYANTLDGIIGSSVIADAPQISKDYEFIIIKGLRCSGEPILTDIDGNVYNNVLMGTQCWMQEDLKTTKYQNGISVPNVTVNATWDNLTTAAYSWYENDPSWKEFYGALYNWYAVVDENNLCPTGWHIPTHDEWTMLTDFIGGTIAPHGNELKSCRQVDSPIGVQCSTNDNPRWNLNNEAWGTDDYGFSALPAGGRSPDGGYFGFIGQAVGWWSSTEDSMGGNAWFRGTVNAFGFIMENAENPQAGYSVRCLRD